MLVTYCKDCNPTFCRLQKKHVVSAAVHEVASVLHCILEQPTSTKALRQALQLQMPKIEKVDEDLLGDDD